jgi:hypothetical protein
MKPFSALTNREKAGEILRWLLVPVALAATVAVLVYVGKVAVPAALAQPPDAPPPRAAMIPRVVVYRALALVMIAATILAGSWTAPRYRVEVATTLATFWIGHAIFYRIVVHIGRGTPHYFDFALAILAAGGAVAVIYFAEKSKRAATARSCEK